MINVIFILGLLLLGVVLVALWIFLLIAMYLAFKELSKLVGVFVSATISIFLGGLLLAYFDWILNLKIMLALIG